MKDYTEIIMLLDMSGSMSSIRDDVIGGTNEFIKQQADQGDNATMTLIVFDSQLPYPKGTIYENRPIREMPEIDSSVYMPRGGTPYYDALCGAIVDVGRRIEALDADNRPSSVIFVTFTDGYENASKVYRQTDARKMIKEKTERGWHFTFLGADIDASTEGTAMGIHKDSAVQVSKRKFREAYTAFSGKLASARSTGVINEVNMAYTEAEKKELAE